MKRGKPSLRQRFDLIPFVPGWRWFLLSIALGAASVLGFAPFYAFPVPIATLAVLAWLWQHTRSAGQALCLGLGFGLGFFFTGTSWVYVSMHDFGGMPWPVACLATAIFCSYFALLPAAAGYVFARIRAKPWVALVVVFPAAWALMEWVRGWTFTGFPWLAAGYSQSPSGPLSGFAAVLGVYGVSLLVAGSAGLLVLLFGAAASTRGEPSVRRAIDVAKHPALVAFAALWLAGWGLQRVEWTAPAGDPVTVTLIQGNFKQDMKWRPEWVRTSLETYLKLTLASRSRLILLPETAIPILSVEVPPAYLDALAEHARSNGGDLLTGIPEYVLGDTARYYNSVFSLGTQPLQTYRKYHLVPFGDYFPHWGFLSWIMNTLDIPMSDFSRGDPYQKPLQVAGQKVAVNICYEDVFGEEIIRQLPEATLLANFTNDSWWGDSVASDQHLQMSQTRAQETGRMMLRATNTGVTAIVDQHGRIVQSAPQFQQAVLDGQAQGRTGSTPYILWGNWVFLGLALAGLLLPWAASRARQQGE